MLCAGRRVRAGQDVPRELDWDGNDPHCVHVVVGDGSPIGIGRTQPDGEIGRLAVYGSIIRLRIA